MCSYYHQRPLEFPRSGLPHGTMLVKNGHTAAGVMLFRATCAVTQSRGVFLTKLCQGPCLQRVSVFMSVACLPWGMQGSYQPWVLKSEGYDEPVKPFAEHGKVDPATHWTTQQERWPHPLPWAWGTCPDGMGIGN